MAAVGLATLNRPDSLWKLTAFIGGPLTLMGAVSGAGSLLLARVSERQALLEAGAGPST